MASWEIPELAMEVSSWKIIELMGFPAMFDYRRLFHYGPIHHLDVTVCSDSRMIVPL